MGVTGCTYRNVYSKFFKGYDIAVMPFIKNSKGRRSTFKDVLPEKNDAGFELIPQILDKRPEDFICLAEKLYDMGYGKVNWNLGCPLPMVRNKKKGSGLLPYTEEIVGVLQKVMPRIPNSVSIKVRLGSESNDDLFRLLPKLNDMPLDEIIIHPRTGKQMYTGEADLTAFERAVSLTNHTVVYNGDIDSLKKYKMLKERFPEITRWMIGRGGVTDPFLPEQIKQIENETPLSGKERFLAFHAALLEAYQEQLSGPAHLIGKMKEVWRYWREAYEEGPRLFADISRTKTAKQYTSVVERFFRSN